MAEAEGRLNEAERAVLAQAFGRPNATTEEVSRATAVLEACGARKTVTEALTCLCREAEGLAKALPVSLPARAMLAGAATALLPKDSTPNTAPLFKDAV
jgi:hypothetical protein